MYGAEGGGGINFRTNSYVKKGVHEKSMYGNNSTQFSLIQVNLDFDIKFSFTSIGKNYLFLDYPCMSSELSWKI